jgi:hypothetical protein
MENYIFIAYKSKGILKALLELYNPGHFYLSTSTHMVLIYCASLKYFFLFFTSLYSALQNSSQTAYDTLLVLTNLFNYISQSP